MVTESFPLRRAAASFEISFTKWLRGAKTVQLPVTFSMSCQIFTSILFPSLKNIQEDLPKTKKSCALCRNFISIYKINRAQLFEGRLALNPGLNLTRVSFYASGGYLQRNRCYISFIESVQSSIKNARTCHFPVPKSRQQYFHAICIS